MDLKRYLVREEAEKLLRTSGNKGFITPRAGSPYGTKRRKGRKASGVKEPHVKNPTRESWEHGKPTGTGPAAGNNRSPHRKHARKGLRSHGKDVQASGPYGEGAFKDK